MNGSIDVGIQGLSVACAMGRTVVGNPYVPHACEYLAARK
jgi:hypothetical protein